MPAPVACPTCGTDGTAAANDTIAQSMTAQAPVSPSDTAHLRLASGHQTGSGVAAASATARPPTRRQNALLPGQAAHTQAIFEARAKISWGDPPKEVLKYLMIQGFSYQDASQVVSELFQERAAIIRANGIKYIIGGIPLILIPVAGYITFRNMGMLLTRTFITMFLVTMVIGLMGVWILIKGIFMVAAPTSESGDVAEQ
jgi:hypothetical protein